MLKVIKFIYWGWGDNSLLRWFVNLGRDLLKLIIEVMVFRI